KTTKRAAPAPAPIVAGDQAKLPPADRVFTGGGRVLGATRDRLWAARAKADGGWTIDWVVQGPGVAHRVTHIHGAEGKVYVVAWGVGRGFLKAPLVLMRHDAASGQRQELWRDAGQRNESAHLSSVDLNADGIPDVAFAYYASKYMVRTRHMLSNPADAGPGPGSLVQEGKDVRMASSRAYGDLDGDKTIDEVVGRVYGDAKGEPGDLTVHFGNGKTVKVPSDRGIKAVWIGKAGNDARPALYFSDGWESNYGKKAKAQIKRATFGKGATPPVEIGNSAKEFTFFDISPADLDGDGTPELIVRGNENLSAFSQAPGKADGAWTRRMLAGLQPVLNTAVGETPGGWVAYIPTNPRAPNVPLRVVPLAAKK
ncbi:MAG: hypothetical protein ACI9U2_003871, partial [Bradymonadia bacterium]